MLRGDRRANRVGGTRSQVTRRRRRVASQRRRLVAAGATAVVLAGGGVTYASTVGFGHNQVGSTYANGIQVSDDQVLKPLGDRVLTRFGKFMGSTVSADGRFLAATSIDKSVALAAGVSAGIGFDERLGALLGRRGVHPHDLPAVAVEVEEAA
ncbi:MAG: hypothetical protein QOK21_2091 [Solirubrobacteraceae bacterium]|nr:hypothetical protein [Solirubrobacteraceae bacterium]